MPLNLIYPDAAELRMIEQDLIPRMMAERPVFDFFPVEQSDEWLLFWEQLDTYTGLQQARGLGGAPERVKRLGYSRYMAEPGVFGEFVLIDETELTRRRAPGQFGGGPIDLSVIVRTEQERLLKRELDLQEQIAWNLIINGNYSVSTPRGSVVATDTYTFQTFTATVPWATVATAHPLLDLRTLKLQQRGHSVSFGGDATLYMNAATALNFYNNQNSADLYGRRTAGFGTVNSPSQVNAILTGDNLPTITEYDGGYVDESGTFQLYIPNNKAILIGKRPNNTPVGAYRLVRNVNNPDMGPGSYTRVINRDDHVPRSVEIHRGHNGGPVVFYPSAVMLLNV